MVVVGVVLLQAQLVVAAPAERRADDASRVFARPPVEADHHLPVRSMGVAGAVEVLDDLGPAGEGLGVDAALIGPGAIERGDPGVAAADGQVPGIEAGEQDGFLPLVVDPGPGLDHVFLAEALVVEADGDRIDAVLQGDGQQFAVVPSSDGPVRHGQREGLVAVGLRDGEGRLGRAAQAIGRIGRLAPEAGVPEYCRVGDGAAIVDDPGVPSFFEVDGQGRVLGLKQEDAQKREQKMHYSSILILCLPGSYGMNRLPPRPVLWIVKSYSASLKRRTTR